MHPRTPLLAAVLLTVAPSLAQNPAAPEYYKLEDTQGRTIEAVILSVEDGQVTLRTKAGRTSTVSLDKFAEISQKDILGWQAESGGTQQTAGSGDWNVETISESTEKSIYRTRHFEVNCDSLLSANIVAQFTPILEGTYYALRSLPLGSLRPEPAEGDRFSVGILEDERSFRVLAGRIPDSAVGSYNHSNKELLLPIARIGITKSNGAFSVRPVRRNPGLVHETTLLLLQKDIESLPPWLVKGVAEYLAAADYRDQKLVFQNHNKNIARHLQEVYKISPKAIPVTPFDRLVGLDYPTWTASSEKERQSFTVSSMLAIYFLTELDNQGRNLRSYTSALTSGKEAGDALAQALNGRSFDEFSADMQAALTRQGLTIAKG